MTGTENGCIDIFDISQEKFNRVGYITHIPDAIQQIDWSSNSQFIRVGHRRYSSLEK